MLPLKRRVFQNLLYDCEDILKATHVTEYHKGNTKVALTAFINKKKVVLKSIFAASYYKTHTLGQFLLETLMLRQLNNQHLVKLLGFCVRGYDDVRTIKGPVLSKGFMGVYEYGPNIEHQIHHYNTSQLINLGQDLLELLYYFHHSPLGSIRHPDFKLKQFISVDGVSKLVDLDELYAGDDPSCKTKSEKICANYNTTCVMHKCYNYDVKFNIRQWLRIFEHLAKYIYNTKALQALQVATYQTNITIESAQRSLNLFKESVL